MHFTKVLSRLCSPEIVDYFQRFYKLVNINQEGRQNIVGILTKEGRVLDLFNLRKAFVYKILYLVRLMRTPQVIFSQLRRP